MLAAACCAYLSHHVYSDEAVDIQQKIKFKKVAYCLGKPLSKTKFAEFTDHFLVECLSAK